MPLRIFARKRETLFLKHHKSKQAHLEIYPGNFPNFSVWDPTRVQNSTIKIFCKLKFRKIFISHFVKTWLFWGFFTVIDIFHKILNFYFSEKLAMHFSSLVWYNLNFFRKLPGRLSRCACLLLWCFRNKVSRFLAKNRTGMLPKFWKKYFCVLWFLKRQPWSFGVVLMIIRPEWCYQR